jgi:uncharacterized protein YdgA (DUF945 family)
MSATAKRFILAVIIFLGLLVMAALILPGVVGWQLQSALEGQLGGKGLRAPNGLHVQLNSFERGWFQSRASVAVRSPQLPFPLQIEQGIIHGPLYFGELRHARSPLILLAINASLKASFDNQLESLAVGSTVLSPLLKLSSDWKLVDGLLELSSMPAWVQLRYQVMSGETELQASIPSLDYSKGREAFSLEDLRLKAEGIVRPEQMMAGELRFSIQEFSSPKGSAPLQLHDLRLLLQARPTSNRINLNMDISLSSAELGTNDYGPLRTVVDVNNVPEDKLQQLLEAQALWSGLLAQNLSQSKRQQIINQQLLPVLTPVLSDSEIKVKELLIRSSDGWVEGNLLASFESQQEMNTLLDLGMAVDLKSEIQISRSWLLAIMEAQLRQQLESQSSGQKGPLDRDNRDEQALLQADRLLQNLVKQRYLKSSSGVYSSQIRINDARLFMNDNEVDLFSLIQ